MGAPPSGTSARLELPYSLCAGTSIPSAEYCLILLRRVRTDTPSTRAARVRLPSQRARVCSTSSRSTSPTVAPISSGTIWFGVSEDAAASGADSWVMTPPDQRPPPTVERKHRETNKPPADGTVGGVG